MSKSLELHRKLKGKIEIKPKMFIRSNKQLSMIYTPGVADVSREIFKNGNARDYTIRGNAVAVVTDGSSVLGLGNIGPYAALPVMEGKCVIMKEFAGIDTFPLCLNTQDPKEIIRTVKSISPVFSAIMLEDIKSPECFEIEKELQGIGIPVIHDDQHATAIAALAGLINSAKVVGKDIKKMKIVVNGAGAAGVAIAKLLRAYGIKDIIVCDSHGMIHKGRKGLNESKREIAGITNRGGIKGSLQDAMRDSDAFIGVSIGNIVTPEMVKSMSDSPIVFGLANPVPEIMPAKAKAAGARVIATGRSDFPNQINNALVFPGLYRGLLDGRIKRIDYKIKIAAAEALASIVKKPRPGKILPSVFDKRIVKAISRAVR